MTRQQRIVAVGAASGIATMILAMWAGYQMLSAPIGLESTVDRLAYAVRWNAIAALPLLVGVIAVGNARFMSEAIDPTAHRESKRMEIDGRVVENSFQQFILFAAGTLAVAAGIAPERLQIIAAAAIVFVVARILFWVGYRLNPLYRAFGMAATGYLNLALLCAALWLHFRR